MHPSDSNQGEEATWRVVAASVRGTSHQKTGKPCQDIHRWRHLPDGVLVAAVADGAGSAALAEIGAEAAAQSAIDTICSRLQPAMLPSDDDGWRDILTAALEAARFAVEAEAVAREAKARDLATTLIIVVATPNLVAAAQVGDGAAVLCDTLGEVIPLTSPRNGEYLNEVTFLISPNALETAQVAIWHGKAAQIALLSDGLQMLALTMPAGTPHAPFFAPFFQFVTSETDAAMANEKLVAFLESPTVISRADDDLTLFLAAFPR